MKIQLRYFASLREALGLAAETLECEAADVATLRALLIARGGNWQMLASPRMRAAINQELAVEGAGLSEGDEVAFFPPVTGG